MSRWGQRVRVLRVGTRQELTLLVVFGFLVTLAIGVGAAFATRSVAQDQALEDSERVTERMAKFVVGPLWADYRSGDAHAKTDLLRAVNDRIIDGTVTEVTVWSADAEVLFSNKAEDIGRKLDPPDDLPDALRGRTTSRFEDDPPEADTASSGAAPGTNGDAGDPRYVEVYAPFDIPGQPRMVFEAYYNYDRVEQLADRLLRQTLPLVLVPLLILQLVQVPIAISLARRIKRHEHERSRLLERALSVSDRERVRFAADLHDGPIQDLAGIGYALGAVAPTVVQQHAPLMARVQDALQRAIESLRSLMTDLYPPDLRSGNLDQAVSTLAEPLRQSGVEVELRFEEVPALGEEGAATLYRVAREALANVAKHAQASTVQVTLESIPDARGGTEPWVRLVVADDGVGVDPSRLDRRAEGHLGLRLLVDRVESLGGHFVITSAGGQGTTVRAELPVSAGAAD